MKKNKCLRCGHEWIKRVENPVFCPACRSPYWNRERIRKCGSEEPEMAEEKKNVKSFKDIMKE